MGIRTGSIPLFSSTTASNQTADLGQNIMTTPLFLHAMPEQLVLLGGADPYGYSRITLTRRSVTKSILQSQDGAQLGNNRFWIRGANFTDGSPISLQVRTEQVYDVSPTMNGLSNVASSLPRLEVVTSSQTFATTERGNDLVVLYSTASTIPGVLGFIRRSGRILARGAQTLPFQCVAVNIPSIVNFTTRRIELFSGAPRTSGDEDEWGYRAIFFLNASGTFTALDSIDGEPIGQNFFFVGSRGRNVRQSNTYDVPFEGLTTSTTRTTTTFTATTFTTSTSSTSTTSTTSSTVTFTVPTNRPMECPSYVVWQSLLGSVCGGCEALVDVTLFDNRCDRYCTSLGLECADAWQSAEGTCTRSRQIHCNRPIQNAEQGLLCTCVKFQATLTSTDDAQLCNSYSTWPSLVSVCGACKAAVPLRDASLSVDLRNPSLNVGFTCNEYCRSFGHTCFEAGLGTVTCSIQQRLNCHDDFLQRDGQAVCTCMLRL